MREFLIRWLGGYTIGDLFLNHEEILQEVYGQKHNKWNQAGEYDETKCVVICNTYGRQNRHVWDASAVCRRCEVEPAMHSSGKYTWLVFDTAEECQTFKETNKRLHDEWQADMEKKIAPPE